MANGANATCKWVYARGLTLDELRLLDIDDENIFELSVDFTGPRGGKYSAIHVFSQQKPYIHLNRRTEYVLTNTSVQRRDLKDFEYVEGVVVEETGGRPLGVSSNGYYSLFGWPTSRPETKKEKGKKAMKPREQTIIVYDETTGISHTDNTLFRLIRLPQRLTIPLVADYAGRYKERFNGLRISGTFTDISVDDFNRLERELEGPKDLKRVYCGEISWEAPKKKRSPAGRRQ